MKRLLFLLTFIPLFAIGQENQFSHKKKIDIFASEAGYTTKTIDYELSTLRGDKGLYHYINACVRKVVKGEDTKYFYKLESNEKGIENAIAYVEYSDLKEIQNILQSLKSEAESDILLANDYLENKFTSDDYFYIGYYIKKKKVTWFIRLDRIGTNQYGYFTSVETIEESINSALAKIEDLMK